MPLKLPFPGSNGIYLEREGITLLENGQPSPPPSLRKINAWPKEWWERVVEWEHPNTKDVLSPFVMFREQETTLPLKYI
jgi:hypothetical protein